MHEIRVCLAHLLQCFAFELDTSVPVELSPDIVLRTVHGLWLKISALKETDAC